ncbi:MAG: diguanylate cyclase, partial [Desulfobulbus sp.]|nr:diguanylate cyclase [Desulfobulbus sp.]
MSSVLTDFRLAGVLLLLPLFALLIIGESLVADQLKQRIEDEARLGAEAVQQIVNTASETSFAQLLRTTADQNLIFLGSLYQKQQDGQLTPSAAQSIALESLAHQTLGQQGFLFAFNRSGEILGHPEKALTNMMLNPVLIDRLQQLSPLKTGTHEGYLLQDSRKRQSLTLYKVVFKPWDWNLAFVCSSSELREMVALPVVAATLITKEFAGRFKPFLLDRNGHLYLPASLSKRPLNNDQAGHELLAAALRQNKNDVTTWPIMQPDQTIVHSTFVFREIPALQLFTGVYCDDGSMYQPVATFHRHALLFLALLLLSTLTTLYVFFRKRSVSLAHVAQTLTSPSLDTVRLSSGTPDEMAVLATVFNRLRSENRQLQEFIDTLRSEAEQLHQQIESEQSDRNRIALQLQTETATRASAEKYLLLFKGIFDNAIEGIYVTDRRGRILTVNHSFVRLTGYQLAEVIGKHPNLLNFSRGDRRSEKEIWENLEKKGSWTGEVWNQNKNGTICPQWLSISAIKNDQQEISHYFAFFHDISDLKKKEKQISLMAYSDTLTGLPNRAALEFRIAKAIARAERDQSVLAVFFIDLDNFKNINDSLGHDQGDQVLVEVANRLSRIIRNEDTLSRLGGDEFILLSENIDNENTVYLLVNRIFAVLERPIELKATTLYVNASIGIALFPNDGQTTQELIKNADMAMYKAKSEGKNKFVMFTQEMNDKLLNRIKIERSIRIGLERREFSVFYQPKINLKDEQPTSFEALVRWQKDGQTLGPEQFIPIAEEAGLIDDMSLYVLDEVCLFLCRLKENDIQTLPISINMSPRTFNHPDIVTTIDNILAIHAVDHHLIEFEITETTAMKDVRHTLSTMQDFRQRGIRFSI